MIDMSAKEFKLPVDNIGPKMTSVIKRITTDIDSGVALRTDETHELDQATLSWLTRPLPHDATRNTQTDFWYLADISSGIKEQLALPVVEVPAVFRQATRALTLRHTDQKKLLSELASSKWKLLSSDQNAGGQLGLTTGYFASSKECGSCVHPLTWSCVNLYQVHQRSRA